MSYVSHEDFVRAWVTSRSVAEVARKTGIEFQQAIYKGRYLRSQGVRLPIFTTRKTQKHSRKEGVDIEKLNNIILAFKAGKL